MINITNILEGIIVNKRKEVALQKSLYPVKLLEKSIHFDVRPVSMKKYLQREDKSGIIAEFKRKSPSKGIINNQVSVENVSIGYMQAGASALSILTDKTYFGGSNEDLLVAREFNYCPILRKEFIVDEYQIIEAKSIGADAILLIAAVLNPAEIVQLASFAKSLGLEVLLEVHNKNELENSSVSPIDMLGINNRNLKTFEVSIEAAKKLAGQIPNDFVKVVESGISDPETIVELKKYGYQGFLIGEAFMKTTRPAHTCSKFVKELTTLQTSIL